jgi:hypothetical protein
VDLFEIGMLTNLFVKLLEDSHHTLHPQLNLLVEKSTQTEVAKIRQNQGRKDGRNSARRPNEQVVRVAVSELLCLEALPSSDFLRRGGAT